MPEEMNPYSSPRSEEMKAAVCTETPLATYFERRSPSMTREYSLFPDHLAMRLRQTSMRSEMTFQLINLRARPNRVFISNRANRVVLAIGMTVLAVLLAFPASTTDVFAPFVVTGVLAAGAWLWVLLAGPMTEYAQFVLQNDSVAFDVAKAGGQRDQFDSFVTLLEQQIRLSQQNTTKEGP
jgi:hypothetical protein